MQMSFLIFLRFCPMSVAIAINYSSLTCLYPQLRWKPCLPVSFSLLPYLPFFPLHYFQLGINFFFFKYSNRFHIFLSYPSIFLYFFELWIIHPSEGLSCCGLKWLYPQLRRKPCLSSSVFFLPYFAFLPLRPYLHSAFHFGLENSLFVLSDASSELEVHSL